MNGPATGDAAAGPGDAARDRDERMLRRAHAWLDDDPDPVTAAELESLLEAAENGDATARAELHDRFDTRLDFGTAGLRGRLGAGPNRMNRVLVAHAAAGLAAFLLARQRNPSVVIGYDARAGSEVFARDTAEILSGAGVRARLLPRLLPTPVLAFAVRHLEADAGVMVTASHNPPGDNGYKVYLGGDDAGSQIVPPSDSRIAGHIDAAAATSLHDLPRSRRYEVLGDEVVSAYIEAAARPARRALAQSSAGARPGRAEPAPGIAATSPTEALTAAQRLTVVYTPLHGVGGETVARVFAAAGLPEVVTVPRQAAPDPDFPTVEFPNPEEPGALDLALERARQVRADLVLANDPDADRLAVAYPDPLGYRVLTGNELGALLGWLLASDAAARGEHGTLAVSFVSSPALAAVAAEYGHDFVETPTGFKWVSRAPRLLYGFEEALGYLVNPETVRDKDGVSAAALTVALAARLAATGRTLGELLDDFTERYGAYASELVALRFETRTPLSTLMTRLREHPPSRIGQAPVTRVDDFAHGLDGFPPSDVVRLALDDGSRVTVRPSGTEPKLKIYVDAFCDRGNVAERTRTASNRARVLAQAARCLVT